MKNFNIVKLDSKGRIIVPYHIRDHLGMAEGQEMVITDNEHREIRIFPLMKGKTAVMRILMDDKPGSLSKIINMVADTRADIVSSVSRTLQKGQSAEWMAILDITQCNGDIKKVEKRLTSMKIIKKVEVEEK